MDEYIHPVKKLVFEYLKEIKEQELSRYSSGHASPQLISKILEYCIPKISGSNKNRVENFAILATSILHYLLTNLLIPSQRKVRYRGLDLDIVVPNLKTLESNPDNSIIIIIPKTTEQTEINSELKYVMRVQPNPNKLWLVVSKDLNTNCKKYIVETNFQYIIEDITKTLDLNKANKLNIFKT